MNSLFVKKVLAIFCGLTLILSGVKAQKSFYRIDSIPVIKGGRTLKFPWVGGLNSPQFSAGDLNGDGIQDLIIFDRTSQTFLTFINTGAKDSISYIYAPQYEQNFPLCHDFALLRDYNCDGIPDIFSSTYSGIQVFRGSIDTIGQIHFTLASPLLTFPYGGFPVNVFVSGNDLPAIDDIDGDGDIDVLAFDVLGGYINFYRNTSVESGSGCDSLNYKWQTPCWGNVFENYYLTMLLNTCATYKPPPHGDTSQKTASHAGNTLCTFDADSNGLKSALWGGITFPYSVFLHNGGGIIGDSLMFSLTSTCCHSVLKNIAGDSAHIDYQDTTFPSYDIPNSTQTFPAAFSLDVNNDGKKDLLFSPNSVGSGEDYYCVNYYENTGTNAKQHYSFKGDSLFTSDMIDVGTGSAPAFFDYNQDGLLDLVIGSHGMFNKNFNSNGTLTLYKNIGTAKHPSFELISSDFASISNYQLADVVPTFGDLRGNGTEDMILGNSSGTLYYFQNVAGIGNPAQFVLSSSFYDSINVGSNSAPQLVDVDHDGLLDLIIGAQNGYLSYYHNVGTKTAPKFQLDTTNNSRWGGVSVRQTGYYSGFSYPFLSKLDSTGKDILLVGSQRGYIYRYDSIDNNIEGKFIKTDSIFDGLLPGLHSSVSGGNIYGDTSEELILGNYRGGVTIYTYEKKPKFIDLGMQQIQNLWLNATLYPNPADNTITIVLPGIEQYNNVKLQIFDELGRVVSNRSIPSYEGKISVDVSNLTAGLYFCRITSGNNFVMRKFIISHSK